jgi:hypothetical protein
LLLIRMNAAETSASSATDQDERRGDQRLERDRALDRADRRVEVAHDG